MLVELGGEELRFLHQKISGSSTQREAEVAAELRKKLTPLSPMPTGEYLALGGSTCPFCWVGAAGSLGEVEVEQGKAHQKLKCSTCHKQWLDLYTLTGYEETEDD